MNWKKLKVEFNNHHIYNRLDYGEGQKKQFMT